MGHREKLEAAKDFAREYWPLMLASTMAGSAILLLIAYYRKKRKEDGKSEKDLIVFEKEAQMGFDETAMLLETGEALARVLREEDVGAVASAMAAEAPDAERRDAMNTLVALHKTAK